MVPFNFDEAKNCQLVEPFSNISFNRACSNSAHHTSPKFDKPVSYMEVNTNMGKGNPMHKLLPLPIVLALSLGACTTTGIGSTFSNIGTTVSAIRGVKITQTQLDGMVAAYDTTVLRPYNIYRYSDADYKIPRRYCTISQPFTVASPCARYSILNKLQPILKTVEVSRKNLQEDVTACNTAGDQTACAGMSATIAAFNSSISIAKSALTQFGVI